MSNKIDFHLHTLASDGSDSIPELLCKLEQEQILAFSITDHDTIEGAIEMDSLVPDHIHYIRGIEFSCITPHRKCHILGYDFDPKDPVFLAALQLGSKLRAEKTHLRIHFLESEFGILLTDEEKNWLFSQNSPGKPHLGRILINRGLAPDLTTAIKKYIDPCVGGKDRIDADIAIHAILHAGGVPIWAHPLGGEGKRRLTEEEFEENFAELLSYGIKGLECFYSRYEEKDIQFLLSQARKHNLLISGGSDYHGKNKDDLHIGKLSANDMSVAQEELTLYNYFNL